MRNSLCKNILNVWLIGLFAIITVMGLALNNYSGETEELKIMAIDEKPVLPQMVLDGSLNEETLAKKEAARQAKLKYIQEWEAGRIKADDVPDTICIRMVDINEFPELKYRAGVEDFESDWPDDYWFAYDLDGDDGRDYWDDTTCPYPCYPAQGSWHAWCADNGSNCGRYDEDMEAIMYVECEYYGTTTEGNNNLYFYLYQVVEDCCDYAYLEIEAFQNMPPH